MRRGRQRTTQWVDMNRLRRLTLEINEEFIKAVPITPKQPDLTLHIDKIYTDLALRENLLIHQRTYVRDTDLPAYVPINKPHDLFYRKDGDPFRGELIRRIYVEAPAGYGKTAFCQYLLSCWCKAKRAQSLDDLSEWERGVGKFDFVFYIPMHSVDENRSKMQDMLRYDIFKDYPDILDSIDEAFVSTDYTILVIMDGLDVWNPTTAVKMDLRHHGIPDIESLSKTAMMYTYRPWVIDNLRFDIDRYERFVEITGLCSEGPDILMEKVLMNCFKVKKEDIDRDPVIEKIRSISKHLKMKSLANIPFFTSAFVFLSYSTSTVERSLANFIVLMVEFIIENARKKIEIGSAIDTSANKALEYDDKDYQIPRFVKENKDLSMCIHALTRTGKVMLGLMITKDTRLCVNKGDISRRIGGGEKKFLLHTGLLNTYLGPRGITINMSELVFVHRFLQDFSVALHVVCEKSTGLPKLMEHCSSVENVLEFANVFKIIAGVDPSVSCKLSKHIVNVLNNEADVNSYRQRFGDNYRCDTFRKVYELLCECFMETQNCVSMDSVQKEKLDFQIEDILLDGLTPVPVLKATSDLMIRGKKGIASLSISSIPEDLPGLTSGDLSTVLDGASSLQSLYIADRTVQRISSKISSLSRLVLQFIRLSPEASANLQAALKGCSHLRCVTMDSVVNDRSPLELVLKGNKKLAKLTLAYVYCKNVKVSAKHLEDLTIKQVTGSTTEMLQSLPLCVNLTTLYFSYTKNTVDTKTLLEVLPTLKNLRRVLYDGTLQGQSERQYHAAMVKTLLTLSHLESMELRNADMDNNALVLAPKMSRLTQVRLGCVNLTESGWTAFVSSLLAMQQDVDVLFLQTNIDEDNLELIDECNEVVMAVDQGKERLEFTKFSSQKGIFDH